MRNPVQKGGSCGQLPLVIGIGNSLRGDDGVGPAVLTRLEAGTSGCRLRAVHQLTPELCLEVARASRVLFVDADLGLPPGAWHLRRILPSAAPTLDSHRIDPASLLALHRVLCPDGSRPPAWLCGVGPASFERHERLSSAVKNRLPEVERAILDIFLADPEVEATGAPASAPPPSTVRGAPGGQASRR